MVESVATDTQARYRRLSVPPKDHRCVSTIIPLADVDPELVEALLDTSFEPARRRRTAYRMREGTECLAALSFAGLDDNAMLAGTIQCWPLALTDPTGRRHPMIMVGPVAVMPSLQGKGYGQALVTAAVTAIDPRAPLPQVLIGDPEYYGRVFGFSNAHTGAWDLPGPFERHRLLCRTANPSVLPTHGTLGPWLG